MSRGLGPHQRWLLERLARHPGTTLVGLPEWIRLASLAQEQFGPEPTASEAEALRRAARTLHARDLIDLETGGMRPEYVHYRAMPTRRATFVRRRTTAEDYEAAIEQGERLEAEAPEHYDHEHGTPAKLYWRYELRALRESLAAIRRPG